MFITCQIFYCLFVTLYYDIMIYIYILYYCNKIRLIILLINHYCIIIVQLIFSFLILNLNLDFNIIFNFNFNLNFLFQFIFNLNFNFKFQF